MVFVFIKQRMGSYLSDILVAVVRHPAATPTNFTIICKLPNCSIERPSVQCIPLRPNRLSQYRSIPHLPTPTTFSISTIPHAPPPRPPPPPPHPDIIVRITRSITNYFPPTSNHLPIITKPPNSNPNNNNHSNNQQTLSTIRSHKIR